jgi:hypothetical protein
VIKARQTMMQMIAKVLTKGQRANYQRMVGEPFDFAKLNTAPTPTASDSKPEPKPP